MRNLATLGQEPRIHPGSGNFGLGVKQCWKVVWQPGSAVFDAESGNFRLGRPDRAWIWQRALKLCSSGLKGLTKKKKVYRHVEPQTRFGIHTEAANRVASTL
jgi:hypothetical protein